MPYAGSATRNGGREVQSRFGHNSVEPTRRMNRDGSMSSLKNKRTYLEPSNALGNDYLAELR